MKRVLAFLFILVSLSFFCISVSAMEVGFEIQEVSPEEQQKLFSQVFVEQSNQKYISGEELDLYDVNQDGEVLVSIGLGNRINLFDEHGNFIKSYNIQTKSKGTVFAFFDKDDGNLITYFFRDNFLVKFDPEGEMIGAAKASSSDVSSVYHSMKQSLERKVNGVRYDAVETAFWWTPNKLMRIDQDRNEILLYERTIGQFFSQYWRELAARLWLPVLAAYGIALAYRLKQLKRISR